VIPFLGSALRQVQEVEHRRGLLILQVGLIPPEPGPLLAYSIQTMHRS
jgi:hypothetical protein